MATLALTPLKASSLRLGGAFPSEHGIEGASQSWKAGAVLKASSGKIIEATADDVADLLGISLSAASGTTDNPVHFVPAWPEILFEGNLEDQANSDHALVQANLYGRFALQKTAGGIWYLDENDTTNDATVVVRLDPSIGAIGDIRARVLFQFNPLATVWGKTNA